MYTQGGWGFQPPWTWPYRTTRAVTKSKSASPLARERTRNVAGRRGTRNGGGGSSSKARGQHADYKNPLVTSLAAG